MGPSAQQRCANPHPASPGPAPAATRGRQGVQSLRSKTRQPNCSPPLIRLAFGEPPSPAGGRLWPGSFRGKAERSGGPEGRRFGLLRNPFPGGMHFDCGYRDGIYAARNVRIFSVFTGSDCLCPEKKRAAKLPPLQFFSHILPFSASSGAYSSSQLSPVA